MMRCTTDPRKNSRHREWRAGADHDLGDVLGLGDLQQRFGDSPPTTSRKVPPSRRTSSRVPSTRAGLGETVLRDDVDGEEVAPASRRHPGRAPDQPLVVGPPGDPDQDPLARLPWPLDASILHVVLERLVDAVGHPQQGELPQRARGCLPGSSCRGRRRSSRADRCCRGPCAGAARTASCRRARAGRRRGRPRRGSSRAAATPVMRSTTSFNDSRCWMLTVEMTSIPASSSSSTSCQRFSCGSRGRSCARARPPADLGCAGDDRVDVHLLERRTPVVDPRRGTISRSPIAPRSSASVASRRTRSRRRCRGRGGDVPHPASRRSCRPLRRIRRRCGDDRASCRPRGWSALEGQVELRTFTCGSPRNPKVLPSVCASIRASTWSSSRTRARRRHGAPGGARRQG